MTSDHMPPDHVSHLHQARRMLVNRLPPEHDLRKRVRHDDNGKLLPEQPSGRLRTSFDWPPARKRGREVSDPAMVLARRVLMTMWNEKYHLSEEWDRVHDKMSGNRKKFGLRERPYKGSDSRKRSREGSQDTSNNEQSDGPTKILARKKRKRDADTQAAGKRGSNDRPVKRARRMPEIWDSEKAAYLSQSVSEQDGTVAKRSAEYLINSHSAEDSPASRRSVIVELNTKASNEISVPPPQMSWEPPGPTQQHTRRPGRKHNLWGEKMCKDASADVAQ